MFSGAALRMSLHQVAGRASRHALSARDRYRCVNAALNLVGAPLATTTRRAVHSVPARPTRAPVSSTAGGVLTGLGGGLRRVAPVAHGALAPGARRSITTSRERADVGFFERQVQRSLETRANSASNNVLKQEQYLRELNHSNQPEAVIDRVHSGAVNTNSAGVALEYIKALARTDRLDRSTLAHLMNQSSSSSSAAAGAGRGFAAEAGAYGGGGGGGTGPTAAAAAAAAAAGARNGDALLVRVAPPSMWQQLLKFGGTILTVYVVLMIVKSALGGRSSGNGGGLGSMLPGMGDEAGKAVVDEKTRFSDVKGAPEAKDELVEVVQFLKNPSKFTALGGKLPRGVLLVGPPGTGKTLLAKAVAGEAGVPFFYASGSEFEEVFVGLGAMRVRQLFKNAKAHAPCIIFIDEIDAVGQKRTLSVGNSNRQTINQLLSELDGFEGDSGVIVIAATNFAESLDSALTRPGRFDRHVHVQLPDLAARREILELYLDKCPVDATVDANVIARGTPGASGADLANIVNMAAVQASVEDREMLGQSHLEWAKDKIIMGPERKSAVMRPEDLKCTAYHETGHALVAMLTPGSYPIHKATIMPRGQALGMVSQLPEHDVVSMSKKQLLAKLDVLMGGRVAEEVFFGEDEVTTGASSDMQQATTLAVRMVTQYGFTEAGGLAYTESSQLKDMSPEHRAMVDQEVRKILDAAYQRARTLITKNKDKMHLVANALLEHETLTGKELQGLLEGRAIAASE